MIARLTLLVVAVFLLSPALRAESTKNAEGNRERVKVLAKKFGLEIDLEKPTLPMRTPDRAVGGKEATAAEMDAYLPRFLTEWDLYPVEVVRKVGLKRIVLCKEVAYGGQIRNAVPDSESSTLYLEVVRGSYNDAYMRQVIHHDFYHMIDLKDDGILYGDDRWKALNSKDFKYGSGGKNAQNDPNVGVLTKDLPGFLNRYAQTGVEEDKAEVFAYMMIAPKMMDKRAANDPVLKAKTERMRELMQTFSPKADKSFWDKVRKIDRPELD